MEIKVRKDKRAYLYYKQLEYMIKNYKFLLALNLACSNHILIRKIIYIEKGKNTKVTSS